MIDLTGTNIYRVTDGRIVENWENVDVLRTLGQLGADPVPHDASTQSSQG